MTATPSQIKVMPVTPGLLTLADVAVLAQVAPSTIRSYLGPQTKARFPQPTYRSQGYPLWSIPVIIEWLADRPAAPTKARLNEDGSVEVLVPSGYKARKASRQLKSHPVA